MREELWNQLILADIQARYFGTMLERKTARGRMLSLAAAVVSCSALVAAVAKFSPEAIPVVSAVGAVLAVIATHVKTPPDLARVAVEWRQVEREADRLWFRMQAGEEVGRAELDAVREHFGAAARIYPECETKQELVDRARDAALRFRGVEP
jgi:hypothetical protein